MTEFETRVLNINVPEITQKILSLGATKVQDYFYKRYTYNLPNYGKAAAWLRLRTDGHEHTLTYKKQTSKNIDGVEELETAISDFEQTHQIMLTLNPSQIIYYENKRTKYILDDVEFCIDTWPLVPTWLEVESSSEQKVRDILGKLGLTGQDVGNLTVWQTYRDFYNIDIHKYQIFTFDQQTKRQEP